MIEKMVRKRTRSEACGKQRQAGKRKERSKKKAVMTGLRVPKEGTTRRKKIVL